MQDTNIEWCDLVWNPTRGCSRVSPGCRFCYAEKIAARFSVGELKSVKGNPFAFNHAVPFAGFAEFRIIGGKREAHWTGKVSLLEDKLDEPLRRRKWALKFAQEHGRKPRCFVNSMSDLFHEGLPDEAIDRVFATMALCSEIDFLVLTKRGGRLPIYATSRSKTIEYWEHAARLIGYTFKFHDLGGHVHSTCPYPLPNVRLGVSTEDQPRFNERIGPLLKLSEMGWKTMISAEPLLGPIAMEPGLGKLKDSWIIVGGESGDPKARPMNPLWARQIRDQCARSRVPYFHKQNGEFASVSEVAGPGEHHTFEGGETVRRVRKQAAGRLLDGREWNEFPITEGAA